MTPTSASTQDASTRPRTRLSADTAHVGVLVVIVLLVGLMAGAASFNHVHDWTLDNSPDGTADWFGWANAVISELIPTASLIDIGRRRRRNPAAKVGYPMFLLVVAVGISLTAQLAVARPSVFGWMVSALPALAFFALSKLVFTDTATPRPTSDPVTATAPAASPAPSSDTTRVEVRPAAAPHNDQGHQPRHETHPGKEDDTVQRTSAEKTGAPATPEPSGVPATVPATAPAARSEQRFAEPLLDNARTIAASHRDTHGDDINPNQLAVRLRVPTAQAADILTALATNPPTAATTRPHNGHSVTRVTA